MSDAPDTIWIQGGINRQPMSGALYGGWHSEKSGYHREAQYTRTDLADARLAAKDAEIERLREAMKAIARFIDHPAHYKAHIDQICRAALEVELHGS